MAYSNQDRMTDLYLSEHGKPKEKTEATMRLIADKHGEDPSFFCSEEARKQRMQYHDEHKEQREFWGWSTVVCVLMTFVGFACSGALGLIFTIASVVSFIAWSNASVAL